MSADLKVLLVSDQEESLIHLSGIVNEFEKTDNITYRELKTELDRLAPDLIFLIESSDYSNVDWIEYVHSVNTFTPIVFIALSQDFDVLRNVTRAGIKEFLFFRMKMHCCTVDWKVLFIPRFKVSSKL